MSADLHEVPRLLAAIGGVAARAAEAVDDPHLRQQLTAAVSVLDDLADSLDWSETSRRRDRRVVEAVAEAVPGVGIPGPMATEVLLEEVARGIAALVSASESPDDPEVAEVGRALLAARAAERDRAAAAASRDERTT